MIDMASSANPVQELSGNITAVNKCINLATPNEKVDVSVASVVPMMIITGQIMQLECFVILGLRFDVILGTLFIG